MKKTVDVDYSPTIEDAPTLLMEIAGLLERFVPGAQQTIGFKVWYNGRLLHVSETCGQLHRAKGQIVMAILEKRPPSELLCDYCAKTGKRKRTMRRSKRAAQARLEAHPEGEIAPIDIQQRTAAWLG